MFYNDPVDLNSDTWFDLLSDRNITTESDFYVLKLVYESRNHELRGSEIAFKLGLSHHGPVNLQISRFSKRVVAATGIRPPLRSDGKPRWWHVPFLGYEKGGRFPWIMRAELVAAFEKLCGPVDSDIVYADEVIIPEEAPNLFEGTLSRVFVNHYERSRQARNLCIAYHGSRCVICGFDFEKVYGPIGTNKIHVHHLVPLSDIQQEYKVNPIRDLRPVCPNCHLILHSKNEAFTIDEVKEMIERSRNNL